MTLTEYRRLELLYKFDELLNKGVHSLEDAQAISAVVDELTTGERAPAPPPDQVQATVATLDRALRDGRWPSTVKGLTAAASLAHACARAATTGQARRLWQGRADELDARLSHALAATQVASDPASGQVTP